LISTAATLLNLGRVSDVGVEVLRSFPWAKYGVVFSVLFGSRAWGRAVKGDWDIGVWLEDVDRDLDLLRDLARFLGVGEDGVDLVVLNHHERLPCSLVIDILGRGKAIYFRDLDEFLEIKTRLLYPCFDFMIDSEKLDLLRTQIEAVTGKWRR
jgi:predicted nucleotidyltransferase